MQNNPGIYFKFCYILFNRTENGCDYVVTNKELVPKIRGSINYQDEGSGELTPEKMDKLGKLVVIRHKIRAKECLLGTCPPLFE